MARELLNELEHTVQPLQEDGTALVAVFHAVRMATAVRKLVPELQPLALHQGLEALQ